MRCHFMMTDKWLFIGTDQRFSICKERFVKEGKQCRLVQTEVWNEALEKVLRDFKPNHIVFPINELKGHVPLSLLVHRPTLYVGSASKEWLVPFQNKQLTIHHYLQEELFIWQNAHITAEAFLKEFYKETERMVRGASFYIAGFGRVGKMVAQLVQSLGGEVTIVARQASQLAEAKMLGYDSCSIDEVSSYEGSYMVNTIPAKWLRAEKSKALFIFDLASMPGCLREAKYVEYYKILPRLPGKHFPIDAGLALKDAFHRLNST